MSSGLMNRLKWQEQLFVNGTSVHTDYPVTPGDVITVPLDEPAPNFPAESGDLTILFEDAHLLAVDKPAGMLVHPSRAQFTGTLANYVLGHYENTGQSCAFHPITRLDRDTFGVVLLAKNAHIHGILNNLHLQGGFIKTYHALVWGGPHAASGIIDAPIGRLPLPSLLRQVQADGKKSVTEYTLLNRWENMSKLALRPITGRTHQLRVHCAYMGFPILGDPQYKTEESQALSIELGLTSQLLCAKHLSFPHPITGRRMDLTSNADVDDPSI